MLESHSLYWAPLFVVLLVLPETSSSSMLLLGIVLATRNVTTLLGWMSTLLTGRWSSHFWYIKILTQTYNQYLILNFGFALLFFLLFVSYLYHKQQKFYFSSFIFFAHFFEAFNNIAFFSGVLTFSFVFGFLDIRAFCLLGSSEKISLNSTLSFLFKASWIS